MSATSFIIGLLIGLGVGAGGYFAFIQMTGKGLIARAG